MRHPRLASEHLGAPLSPGVAAHNAYVVGWEDGATDHRSDYLGGVQVGGDHYRRGFEAGRAARMSAFEQARSIGRVVDGSGDGSPP